MIEETLGYEYQGHTYCLSHVHDAFKEAEGVKPIRGFDDYGPDGVRCYACNCVIKPEVKT